MFNQPVYQSKFVREDMRNENAFAGVQSRTSTFDETCSIGDVLLKPGESISISPDKGRINLLLPIVGGLFVSVQPALQPGELYGLPQTEQDTTIRNQTEETINFLIISLPAGNCQGLAGNRFALELTQKNRLIPAAGAAQFIRAGVYDSRVKQVVPVSTEDRSLIYNINGSFEVEGRLMEYRDGLLLWGLNEWDFEALSENAIIIIITIKN